MATTTPATSSQHTDHNQQGRSVASVAAQRARRDGLHAAAVAFKVPPATLRRVLGLYRLDQPPGPAGPPALPERR